MTRRLAHVVSNLQASACASPISARLSIWKVRFCNSQRFDLLSQRNQHNAAFCSLQPFAELNLANNQIVDLTTIGIAGLRRLRVIVRLLLFGSLCLSRSAADL